VQLEGDAALAKLTIAKLALQARWQKEVHVCRPSSRRISRRIIVTII